MPRGFVLAVAQFPVFKPDSWAHYERTILSWVRDAARQHARLLVFPEYAAMVLSGLLPEPLQADLRGQIQALQRYGRDYVELHQRLARRYKLHIVAGSFPWTLDDGRIVNRAWVCGPEEGLGFQDKRIMTRFEREEWGIQGGGGLKLFETLLGRVAINICYDVEFPLLARAQVEAGAELILAPSCTDTLGGYHRIRTGCAARALENQCYSAQAPLIGTAPWSPAIDVNRGAAAVFGPPDRGFPDDGVLVQGAMDTPNWICTEIDLSRVAEVRQYGQVYNHRHWREQLEGADGYRLPPVERTFV